MTAPFVGVAPLIVEVLDSDLLVGITGFRLISQLWWWQVFAPGPVVRRVLVGYLIGTALPIWNLRLQSLEFCLQGLDL